MSTVPIRVLLADDHLVVRTGLRAVLRAAPDISVIGEASTGREAIALAMRFHPDVVVMDLGMPDLDGLSATRELVAKVPTCHVLVLTMHPEDEFLIEALQAGASGYLVKDVPEDELVRAIRAVASGDVYVEPSAGRALAKGLMRRPIAAGDRVRLDRLTEREREVLRLVAEGHSAPSIGALLEISAKTVDTYKQRIHEKLQLSGRPDYVNFALRAGLLTVKAPVPA